MKPDGPVKLVGQLLDLPLVDKDGRWCGVVDDVEFTGGAGRETRIKALLVGPGAYRGRLPGWAYWLVRKIAGERVTAVPFSAVETIGGAVQLNKSARALKLDLVDDRAKRWIPEKGAF